MRFNRARATGAAIVALAVVAGACSSSGGSSKTSAGNTTATTKAKPTITIGSEKFSESIIVNEIYAKALEAKGYTVTRKFRLGTREVYEPALERGEITMVADYAATLLEFINNNAGEATPDAAQTVAKLNGRLSSKGLTALDAAPAIDPRERARPELPSQRVTPLDRGPAGPKAPGSWSWSGWPMRGGWDTRCWRSCGAPR